MCLSLDITHRSAIAPIHETFAGAEPNHGKGRFWLVDAVFFGRLPTKLMDATPIRVERVLREASAHWMPYATPNARSVIRRGKERETFVSRAHIRR